MTRPSAGAMEQMLLSTTRPDVQGRKARWGGPSTLTLRLRQAPTGSAAASCRFRGLIRTVLGNSGGTRGHLCQLWLVLAAVLS